MDDVPKILLVDDDADNLRFVQRLLEAENYQVKTAHSGEQGLKALNDERPDLVLLDVNMPGIDGLKTIELLRRKENTTAVVFVTANSNTRDIVKGLDAGALDYIVKPFSGLEFLARVRAQLRVKSLQDELRSANRKLQGLVEIDDLTGLYNMRSIYEKLDQEIERAYRYGHGLSAIMLDMDNFKNVNDNHDHLFGSHVLTEMGGLIKKNIRGHDFAARYGGDEFLICLNQITPSGARKFCERLRKVIESILLKTMKMKSGLQPVWAVLLSSVVSPLWMHGLWFVMQTTAFINPKKEAKILSLLPKSKKTETMLKKRPLAKEEPEINFPKACPVL